MNDARVIPPLGRPYDAGRGKEIASAIMELSRRNFRDLYDDWQSERANRAEEIRIRCRCGRTRVTLRAHDLSPLSAAESWEKAGTSDDWRIRLLPCKCGSGPRVLKAVTIWQAAARAVEAGRIVETRKRANRRHLAIAVERGDIQPREIGQIQTLTTRAVTIHV